MKKLLLSLISLLLAFNAIAQTFTVEYRGQTLKYEVITLDPPKVSVGHNFNSLTGSVEIPDTVKDQGGTIYTVTSIRESGFSQTDITDVFIPKSITSIGKTAFYKCTALNKVDFEENSELKTIWGSAFSYCSSLDSIIIPKEVTGVKSYAFSGCSSLTSVTFLAETPPNLTYQYDVFASTPDTKTLTVPFGSNYSALENYNTTWGEVNYKINAGETKTLNNDFLITTTNKRKVINEGVMVIGHNGQLINATDNNIDGVIEVQTPELAENQWHFVGAPFNNYELEAIKPPAAAQDVAVVLYDYSSGVWNNTFATIADPVSAGEGFFAWPFATESIVFKSTKDNGTNAYTLNNAPEIAVNKTLSNPNNGYWMALANPYPFKLNVAIFLDDQPENTIQGGVSYRFNGTSWTIANEGEINVTEGFFVNFASAGSSTVTFKKTQRNAPSAKVSEAREFIRLSMADDESNIELLFAHNEDAEQGYDIYDANKMFATTGVSEPYFVTEGIALVKEEVKELPYYATMNVRSSESKEVKFKADYIPEGLAVSIIDEEEVIDLTEGVEYATEIASGENADRFKVLVKKNVGLADVEELDVRIVNSNRHIAITAQENVKVSVYNTLGQKVFETEETNFVLSGVASGAYVVKVQGAKASKSQKIVVE